ncbi:dehydrin ERD14-like [Silene latifolia]|uniref:dehydrin ERD14-like n=1 Tax=Silene latifolia TaxID=37657 RepID=UPI003D76E87E
MAENINEQVPASGVETTDRGLFDFMKKDKKEEEKSTLETEFDHKVQVSETGYKKEDEEKKHGGLIEKLHRSDSSSSSSSEDEADDEEKKRKKREKKEKKGLKEKLKEKLPGHKNEEDTNVPIEKYEEKPHPHVHEVTYSEPSHPEEDQDKKGFLDKIKDKLPGQKKVDEHHETVVTPVVAEPCVEGEKDKKGFLDKIKEKIPGFSSKTGEEKKEHADEK